MYEMIHEGILKLESDISVSYRYRVQDRTSDTIVFIHGFGSSKVFFRFAFKEPSLFPFNLVTLDLPGFGNSYISKNFSYSMKDYSELIIRFINKMQLNRFHLCAHSMGGLIGIEISKKLKKRVLSFINLEGNLTWEDCFMSGQINKESFEEFQKKGRDNIENTLLSKSESNPYFKSYLVTFKQATTEALYWSAKDTVDTSVEDQAFTDFIHLSNQCYIYGEKNKNVYPGEIMLLEAGIPVYYIKDSGHAMTEENPGHTYSVIANFINSISD